MSARHAHFASHSKASILRAVGVGAVVAAAFVASAGMAQAASAASQDDCDRLAGSRYDINRNIAFKPVEEAALKGGEDAVNACRVAFSETGNPRFSFQLGRALDNRGDVADAMKAYAAAAEDRYTIAKVHLAFLYGRMGDMKQEFTLFKQAADEGNVLGAYNLAVLYRDGVGTQVDATQAIRWFEDASAKDYGPAAYNLGVIYDEGNLVPEDNARAIEWYKVAVAKGQVDAMVNLALMYEGGEGTKSNLMAAAELYRNAAEKGDQFAAQKFETIGAMVAALKEQQEQMQANSNNMPVIDTEAVGSISKDDTGI